MDFFVERQRIDWIVTSAGDTNMESITVDDELFDVLFWSIKKEIPKFKIKYKNKSLFQKIIGKILFFNKRYMTSYTSTFGYNVYFPSIDYVNKNKRRAFKILAHEFVHMVDRKNGGILFYIFYAFPQFFGLFSLLSVLSIWFSNYWLLSLFFAVFLAPMRSVTRALLEMRGYAMNIMINMIKYGDLLDSTRKHILSVFTGSDYYYMFPDEEYINRLIDVAVESVRKIDRSGLDGVNSIFSESIAYPVVYSILTDIDHVDF